MVQYRSHGIIRNKKKHWEYNINRPGQNFRLSDINCALGLSQLKKVDKFIAYRKKIFNYYRKKFESLGNKISFFDYSNSNNPSFHLFLISINFKKIKKSKNIFMKYMLSNNIICQYHYIPIYKFNIFDGKNLNYKNAEYYYNNTISLPIYYGLKVNEQNYIIKKIEQFFN